MRRTVTLPNAACVVGTTGLSLPEEGVWGPPPGVFSKYKLWKGHFWGNYKDQREKKLKKGFHSNWEKKVFA